MRASIAACSLCSKDAVAINAAARSVCAVISSKMGKSLLLLATQGAAKSSHLNQRSPTQTAELRVKLLRKMPKPLPTTHMDHINKKRESSRPEARTCYLACSISRCERQKFAGSGHCRSTAVRLLAFDTGSLLPRQISVQTTRVASQ